MAKRTAEEEITKEVQEEGEAHPYAFHVSGPRNVPSPNWRDLINSSWSVPISFLFYFIFLLYKDLLLKF